MFAEYWEVEQQVKLFTTSKANKNALSRHELFFLQTYYCDSIFFTAYISAGLFVLVSVLSTFSGFTNTGKSYSEMQHSIIIFVWIFHTIFYMYIFIKNSRQIHTCTFFYVFSQVLFFCAWIWNSNRFYHFAF